MCFLCVTYFMLYIPFRARFFRLEINEYSSIKPGQWESTALTHQRMYYINLQIQDVIHRDNMKMYATQHDSWIVTLDSIHDSCTTFCFRQRSTKTSILPYAMMRLILLCFCCSFTANVFKFRATAGSKVLDGVMCGYRSKENINLILEVLHALFKKLKSSII